MGGAASRSRSRTKSKVKAPAKSTKTALGGNIDDDSKHNGISTVYRVQTCKFGEKCPSIKNIKHGHFSVHDLNHLTECSHPRKHCQSGLQCKHFEQVMKGSYSIASLCHYAIYLHPVSRFITAFPKTDDNKKQATGSGSVAESQSNMYHSLQMPRSGGKDGLLSYKKLGIMVCDGSCGSAITRGLWKCWTFRSLIWNYKYRTYQRHKDPRQRAENHKNAKNDNNSNNDDESKDIYQCLVTMIESVVALAGEAFLIQMYELMTKTKTFLNSESENENKNVAGRGNAARLSHERDPRLRKSLLQSNKYMESFKAELLLKNDADGGGGGQNAPRVISDAERHEMEFGELLLMFSERVGREFKLADDEFPQLKKSKKWQCSMVYCVLIGMTNDALTLRMNGDCDKKQEQQHATRRRKKEPEMNLMKEIFIKGCRHSARDLFKELEANRFNHVLSIPRATDAASEKLNDTATMAADASLSADDHHHHNKVVSSMVAPNAPPTYRRHCEHYANYDATQEFNAEWTSLQEVARQKLHHPRHLEMGSCLEEEELLSLLLLTGTEVGLDLIESHRKYRNYCKWRVLQSNLMSAILKLKRNDPAPNSQQFFHGLLRHADTLNVHNIYLFNTFVSTTLDHRLIESSFANKKDGALLFLDRREPAICADISWISKFPFEHEVLFAPCALTLPSPFDAPAPSEMTSTHGQPQPAPQQQGDISKRVRLDSIAQFAGKYGKKTKQKHPKNAKKGDKKLNFQNKNSKTAHKSSFNAMGFSLVDGRLEALSVAQDAHVKIKKITMTMSASQHQSSTPLPSPLTDKTAVSAFAAAANDTSNISQNMIADFLYGKTTANTLFAALCRHSGDGQFIDEQRLQALFQSLFVFAIRIEYATRNNGIHPKYMNDYMLELCDVAIVNSNRFIEHMHEEQTNDAYSQIDPQRITKQQFIDNAVFLHHLYEQFLEDIIAKEMHLKYQQWENSNNQTPSQNNNSTNARNVTMEVVDHKHNDDDDDTDEDADGDSQITPSASQDAAAAESDEEQKVDEDVLNDVQYIQQFCCGELDLLSLWMHFTQQQKTKQMTYSQFDVLLYTALAYFVHERNPNSPIATRKSLNALIEQLRSSLLAAYDVDNLGHVSYECFAAFGDYLCGEFKKLRGSLADAYHDDEDDEEEYQSGDTEYVSDGDDDEEDDEFEPSDGVDAMVDAQTKTDEAVVQALLKMEENAKSIITHLTQQLQALDDDTLDAENICTDIALQIESLLYLIKEMEIHCLELNNLRARYKKAEMINFIDAKRDEIQQQFQQLIDDDEEEEESE